MILITLSSNIWQFKLQKKRLGWARWFHQTKRKWTRDPFQNQTINHLRLLKTTIEVVDDANNYQQHVFVWNPKNIIEPDDNDDDEADVMAQAAEIKMKQCEPGPSVQKKKTHRNQIVSHRLKRSTIQTMTANMSSHTIWVILSSLMKMSMKQVQQQAEATNLL